VRADSDSAHLQRRARPSCAPACASCTCAPNSVRRWSGSRWPTGLWWQCSLSHPPRPRRARRPKKPLGCAWRWSDRWTTDGVGRSASVIGARASAMDGRDAPRGRPRVVPRARRNVASGAVAPADALGLLSPNHPGDLPPTRPKPWPPSGMLRLHSGTDAHTTTRVNENDPGSYLKGP
jgi:hypothetical protein